MFVITKGWLEERFGEFNRLYFKGVLPLPHFKLTNTKRTLGAFYVERSGDHLTGLRDSYFIDISTYYQRSEWEYNNTLIHEMIHYYIHYKQITDTSPHGKVFTAMMEAINEEGGWDLSVRSEVSAPPSVKNRGKHYIILSMMTSDKGRLIAVVQKSAVAKLEQHLSRNPNVLEHQWYVSMDPHFDRYRATRTLKGYYITEEKWTEILPLVKPLRVVIIEDKQ